VKVCISNWLPGDTDGLRATLCKWLFDLTEHKLLLRSVHMGLI
jgi:hypothetical protein